MVHIASSEQAAHSDTMALNARAHLVLEPACLARKGTLLANRTAVTGQGVGLITMLAEKFSGEFRDLPMFLLEMPADSAVGIIPVVVQGRKNKDLVIGKALSPTF